MGAFWYFSVLVLAAVYQCEGDTNFNKYKTLHPDHVNLKWMKCIPDGTSLSSVSIPGTHQSLKSGGVNEYRNFQAWELQSQLYAGVRFFDMTLWKLFGKLYVENNAVFYYEKFSHVLSQLQIYLRDKKSETMLVRLSGPSKAIHRAKEELNGVTAVKVWKEKRIPTMGEARGKIVLIQSSDFDWGLPINAMVLDTKEKELHWKANIKKATEYCTREMMLTDTGAKGQFEKPRTVAKTLNQQLYEHLFSLKTNMKPPCLGIIAMDFPGPKLVQLIIDISCHLASGRDTSSDTGLNGIVALNESAVGPNPPPNPEPNPSPYPEPNPSPGTPSNPEPNPPTGTPSNPEPNPPTGTPSNPEPNPPTGTPSNPKPNPPTGTPSNPEPNPPTGTPSNPEPNPPTGTPSNPEPNPPTGTPSNPEPNPPIGTPSNPEPNPPTGTPSNPEPNPPTGTPSNPEPNPPTGTPSNPEPNPPTGTPSNPEPNPPTGTPSNPEPNPTTGTPSNPEPNPPTGTPSNPEPNPPTGTPSNPEPNPPTGTPSNPEPNPSPGTPSNPKPNPSPGTPSNPEPNPPTGTPSNPEPNPSPGTPSNPEPNPPTGTPSNPEPNPPTGTPSNPEPNPPTGTPSNPEPNPPTGTPPNPEPNHPPKPGRKRRRKCHRVHRHKKPSPLVSL